MSPRMSAGGRAGSAALEAMGLAYQEKLVTDRDWLLMQLQTFVACYDEDVQQQTRECIKRLWDEVEHLTGPPIEDRTLFFAKGMFRNVIAAAGRLDEAGVADEQRAPIVAAPQKHTERVAD